MNQKTYSETASLDYSLQDSSLDPAIVREEAVRDKAIAEKRAQREKKFSKLDSLVVEYLSAGSLRERDQSSLKIVFQCQGLLYKIASPFHNLNMEEDLLQQGIIGILKTFEEYEHSKGSFFGRAYKRVHDEVVRHAIRNIHSGKVGINYFKNKKKLNQLLEKSPDLSIDNLAAEMKMDKETVKFLMLNVIEHSLDAPVEEGGRDLSEEIPDGSPDQETCLVENYSFDKLISYLDEKEKMVIDLRYRQDKTLDETGLELGIISGFDAITKSLDKTKKHVLSLYAQDRLDGFGKIISSLEETREYILGLPQQDKLFEEISLGFWIIRESFGKVIKNLNVFGDISPEFGIAKESFGELIENLNETEKLLQLKHQYYKSTDRDDKNLYKVNSRFKLTRERIRQIEAKALKRLKKQILLRSPDLAANRY